LAPITVTATQSVKIDAMSVVEIITNAAGNYQYTILFDLLRDGGSIASVTIETDNDTTGTTLAYSEVPSMTWVDVPGAGNFVYTVEITVSGTNIATPANALTRAINAVVIGL